MLNPVNDRVFVQREKAEEKSAGGIVLPNAAKSAPLRGVVVAAGPGRVLENGTQVPLIVKVGDTVYYREYSGDTIEHEGETLLVFKEDDIIGIAG